MDSLAELVGERELSLPQMRPPRDAEAEGAGIESVPRSMARTEANPTGFAPLPVAPRVVPDC